MTEPDRHDGTGVAPFRQQAMLEVGTGLDLQAAIQAMLARQAVSVERLADLT